MTFQQFQTAVSEKILEYLPDEYGGADISIMPVVKNNDTKLSGLMIRKDSDNITSNIYLDGFYQQYVDGRPMDEILKSISECFLANENKPDIDVSILTDYDSVKDKIMCRLINAERNSEYLADKPHILIEDLAVVYCVDFGENENGRMSAPITNALLSQYRIGAEELYTVAMDNLSRSSMEFMSMRDKLIKMMGPEAAAMIPETEADSPDMYILTNGNNNFGAAAVLDRDTMDHISERIGGNFFVLPSSVHEVIILPMRDDIDRADLENMVQEVNMTQVSAEEQLSDHVYAYDSARKELMLADRMEEQLKEKEIQQTQENANQEQAVAFRRHRGR